MNRILRFINILYGQLIRLFSRDFQAEFGEELQGVFSTMMGAAARRGKLALSMACLQELRDFPILLIRTNLEKNQMTQYRRGLALVNLVLILPACLFMFALLVRLWLPLQTGMGIPAQQMIMWYSGRLWTLWLLLVTLPLIALISGWVGLVRSWTGDIELRQAARHPLVAIRTHGPVVFVALETLIAGMILAIVAVHVLMN